MEDNMTQPISQKKLAALFNQFAGREIAVVESKHKMKIGDKEYDIENVDLANKKDATVAEIEKVAAANGLHVRLWLPTWFGTCDWDDRRVNVHVEKEADGKYRVQKHFDLG
jgi:hypothetical protein